MLGQLDKLLQNFLWTAQHNDGVVNTTAAIATTETLVLAYPRFRSLGPKAFLGTWDFLNDELPLEKP